MKRIKSGEVTLLVPEGVADLGEIARLDKAGQIDTRLSFGDGKKKKSEEKA